MKEFFSELNSLYWWISVVIVGILINIVSAYLQKSLDNRFSKMSSWWRNRSEVRNALYQAELQKLHNNKDAQLFLALEELRAWCFAILTSFAALGMQILSVSIKLNDPNDPNLVISVGAGSTITLLLFALGITTTMFFVNDAAKKHELLREAQKLDRLQNKKAKKN